MDFLKKFFPYSFGTTEVSNLVIRTIIYVVAIIIGGVLLGIIGIVNGAIAALGIPVLPALIGALLGLVGSLIELYCIAGIVIMFLAHFKVLKD